MGRLSSILAMASISQVSDHLKSKWVSEDNSNKYFPDGPSVKNQNSIISVVQVLFRINGFLLLLIVLFDIMINMAQVNIFTCNCDKYSLNFSDKRYMEFEIDRFLVHFGRYTISQPEASAQVRSLDHYVHHPGIFMTPL